MGVVDRVALSADVLSRAVIHVLSLVPGEGGRTEPLTPVLATVLEGSLKRFQASGFPQLLEDTDVNPSWKKIFSF